MRSMSERGVYYEGLYGEVVVVPKEVGGKKSIILNFVIDESPLIEVVYDLTKEVWVDRPNYFEAEEVSAEILKFLEEKGLCKLDGKYVKFEESFLRERDPQAYVNYIANYEGREE